MQNWSTSSPPFCAILMPFEASPEAGGQPHWGHPLSVEQVEGGRQQGWISPSPIITPKLWE